ncbi:putative quinol monooxygenase [Paenibacillus gansuensis]|uniref:Quinol monooxygenase n=1 Tax=Paenibacillus gansuensis TaxID=306542 RepID=A0ABW5PII2_9BACL
MATTDQIVIVARFTLKPNMKEKFMQILVPLFDRMSQESTFVNAIVHEDIDNPDEVVFYEIWNCSRETWLAEEATKPYRETPNQQAAEIMVGRTMNWLVPTGEWGSNLTAGKRH